MAKRRMARRRKRTKRRSRRRLSLRAFPVPDSTVCKLRYVQWGQFNTAATGADFTVFRANSIFDPWFTGAGHQPMGFDEWAEFYDTYMVLGARITVTYQSKDATATGFSYVGVTLSDRPSSIAATLEEAMERNNVKFRLLTGISSKGAVTVSKTFSAKRFFGVKDMSDNRGTLGAKVDTNPEEDAYFILTNYSSVDGTDPTSIGFVATIDYIVKFTERKFVPQS